MKWCVYDEIFVMLMIKDKCYLDFDLEISIILVDKTCFLRPSHNLLSGIFNATDCRTIMSSYALGKVAS